MSYCKKEGKDVILFVTEEDHQQPSQERGLFEGDLDDEPGLILDNGEINWNCPCLGGMATGPCGPPFREAFSCFHYSKEEPKGTDCYDSFKAMQDCMLKYPELYGEDDDPKEKEDDSIENSQEPSYPEDPSTEKSEDSSSKS